MLQSEWYYVSAGYLKFAKKKTNTFSMLFFLWAPGIMFFPHCPFFSTIVLHYKPVPHLSMFFLQAPLQADQPLSGKWTCLPHEKTLLRAKQDPTEEATKIKPIFCYTLHFYILRERRATDLPQGTRRKKKKARGARWEGERLLGYAAGASADERGSSPWHLSRWLRFLGEIWC